MGGRRSSHVIGPPADFIAAPTITAAAYVAVRGGLRRANRQRPQRYHRRHLRRLKGDVDLGRHGIEGGAELLRRVGTAAVIASTTFGRRIGAVDPRRVGAVDTRRAGAVDAGRASAVSARRDGAIGSHQVRNAVAAAQLPSSRLP